MTFGYFYKLLFRFSEKNPPIEEQLYLFMKRFRTQPSEFYSMDKQMRLKIYHREWKAVLKENEEAEKLKTK